MRPRLTYPVPFYRRLLWLYLWSRRRKCIRNYLFRPRRNSYAKQSRWVPSSLDENNLQFVPFNYNRRFIKIRIKREIDRSKGKQADFRIIRFLKFLQFYCSMPNNKSKYFILKLNCNGVAAVFISFGAWNKPRMIYASNRLP